MDKVTSLSSMLQSNLYSQIYLCQLPLRVLAMKDQADLAARSFAAYLEHD